MINVQRYTAIDINDEQYMLRFEYANNSVNVLIVADNDENDLLISLDAWTYVDEQTDIVNVQIDCVDYFTDYVMNIAQREKEEA